jgi:hypothetical protein
MCRKRRTTVVLLLDLPQSRVYVVIETKSVASLKNGPSKANYENIRAKLTRTHAHLHMHAHIRNYLKL